MNAQIQTAQLRALAQFSRIWLDGHRAAIRSANSKQEKESAQNAARDFWKFCHNGQIVGLLKQAHAGNPGCLMTVDPWVFESDLAALASECVPGRASSFGPSCDVSSQLSALQESVSIIAGHLSRLQANERNHDPKTNQAIAPRADVARTGEVHPARIVVSVRARQ